MVPRPRKIVEKTYYYATDSESDSEFDFDYEPARDSESESESDATTVVFGECDWELEEVSDSEDGTDYESETEPESDSEELDDPKPYYGKGFRVYFDSHADKKFFMRAFGFHDA
jgi:hypothetical protein